jgi:predicted phage terminase large subunit-like protein
MFQKDDWQYVDRAPEGGKVVRGWDLAATDTKQNKSAAWTVGCKMRLVDGSVYIEDVDRRQVGPSAVEKMIKANAVKDGLQCVQDLPQDPGQAGKAQKLTIGKLLQGYKFQFSTESGSKEERAMPFAAQVEIHNVYLVRGRWNNSFINELSLHPNGQFKDQADAASRAYFALLRKKTKLVGVAPSVITD